MIKPTINGVLNIIRSCVKAKTVKRLVFTSSAGTVDVEEHKQTAYDENSWSDLDFIYSKKMLGWVRILPLPFPPLPRIFKDDDYRLVFFITFALI